MSTLIDEHNAPRNEAELAQFSTAILYRLGMRLNIFANVEKEKKEEAERAFCSLPSAEKAPIILRHLLAYDQNPQAAQAHMMVAPGAQPAGAQSPMTQGNYQGAPPGAGAPPGYQQQLPYQGPPAQHGFGAPPGPPQGPPGGWQAPPGAGAPPGFGGGGPPGYATQGPPQGAPPGPPQGSWQPPGPPGGGGFAPPVPPQGSPNGFASPPNMGAPPGPPQGGWQPPGPPQGAPQGAPPGPPQGWQPPGAQAPSGPPTGAPPGYPPQGAPPRAPQTPSDPGNQGSVSGQLLNAIQGLAAELQRQNEILAGLSTLVETNFIASVIMAGRMAISNDELAHRLASERETVRAQFLKTGK